MICVCGRDVLSSQRHLSVRRTSTAALTDTSPLSVPPMNFSAFLGFWQFFLMEGQSWATQYFGFPCVSPGTPTGDLAALRVLVSVGTRRRRLVQGETPPTAPERDKEQTQQTNATERDRSRWGSCTSTCLGLIRTGVKAGRSREEPHRGRCTKGYPPAERGVKQSQGNVGQQGQV